MIIDFIVIIVYIAFIFVLFNNCYYCHYGGYHSYLDYWLYCIYSGWLGSIGSRAVYELGHKNPILYVILIQSILGKLLVVPVGDTGTIPHHLCHHFPGAPGDPGRRPGLESGRCNTWV